MDAAAASLAKEAKEDVNWPYMDAQGSNIDDRATTFRCVVTVTYLAFGSCCRTIPLRVICRYSNRCSLKCSVSATVGALVARSLLAASSEDGAVGPLIVP